MDTLEGCSGIYGTPSRVLGLQLEQPNKGKQQENASASMLVQQPQSQQSLIGETF